VVEALGDLGDPRAVDALVDVLKSDDLRFEAILALEKLGDPSAVGPLEALQDDPSELVRDRAARALESLDSSRLEARRKELADRGLAGLVAILGGERISDDGIEAMKLLTDAGERAVPLLVDSLGSHDWTVRWRSAVILGRIGDRAAAQPLIDALSDSNVEVRFYAAEALGRLGDPSAVGPLIAALHDSGNYVQQAAAEALGNLGDSRAAEPLTTAAQQAREDYVREAAAKALEKIGS